MTPEHTDLDLSAEGIAAPADDLKPSKIPHPSSLLARCHCGHTGDSHIVVGPHQPCDYQESVFSDIARTGPSGPKCTCPQFTPAQESQASPLIDNPKEASDVILQIRVQGPTTGVPVAIQIHVAAVDVSGVAGVERPLASFHPQPGQMIQSAPLRLSDAFGGMIPSRWTIRASHPTQVEIASAAVATKTKPDPIGSGGQILFESKYSEALHIRPGPIEGINHPVTPKDWEQWPT